MKLKIPQIEGLIIGVIIVICLSLGIILSLWDQRTTHNISASRLHPCGTATLIDNNGKTIMSWKIQDGEMWNFGDRAVSIILCNKTGTKVQLYLGDRQTLIYEPDGTKRILPETKEKE